MHSFCVLFEENGPACKRRGEFANEAAHESATEMLLFFMVPAHPFLFRIVRLGPIIIGSIHKC